MSIGTPSNRLLRLGLVVVYLVFLGAAWARHLLVEYPLGVDLEIPLRAAERWAAGGQPYLASAFSSPFGATQPFLYPPYVLPLASALLHLPRFPVELTWVAICLVSAVFVVRRLAFPPLWWPFVLAWPPFAEGIIVGNVQIPVFALFVAVFWQPHARGPLRPIEDAVDDPARSTVRIGLATALIGAVKVAEFQPFLLLVRRRPRAALVGLAAGLILIATSLPLTGAGLWFDWVDQLRRASDPGWDLGGFALARFLPAGLGLVVSIGTVLAVLSLPRRGPTGASIGVLSVLGTPTLHTHGLLFLLPAMLLIRREVALVAAIAITSYSYEGAWAGIAIVALTFLAGFRWKVLQEPASDRSLRGSPDGAPTG